MTHLYFMGAEQGGWRTLLAEAGATHVGVSYYALRRRMPRKGVRLADWGFAHVLLDSGGYTANKTPDKHTVGQWRQYGESYATFATEQASDVELVVEFDCNVLGPEWIAGQRATVWSQIDPAKFVPVWQPDQGLHELERLSDNYRWVAVTDAAFSDRAVDPTPQLNAIAGRGVRLLGLAMTKPEVMRRVDFAAVSSSSWLSPMRFGDTIVWDGGKLVRYPVRYKESTRLRYQSLFEQAGFDPALIAADDNTEVARFTLWSWLQFEEHLRGLRPDRGNHDDDEADPDAMSVELSLVDTVGTPRRNEMLPRAPLTPREPDEIRMLPMFGLRDVVTKATEEGQDDITEAVIEVRGTSSRRCDTCVIRTECEWFKANSTCALNLPVEVRTPAQKRALMETLIELQTQRVGFGAHVEALRGGYPDPNLSTEYDRLLKAISTMAELEDGRDFLKISVEARGGGGGLLSQLFGGAAAKATKPSPMRRLDPGETDTVITRVLDGEKVT